MRAADRNDAAELLRRVLSRVAAGALTAPERLTARLEGALIGLEVQGRRRRRHRRPKP